MNLPDETVGALVRERLENGHLPLALSTTLYAGQGTGTECAVCCQSVTRCEVEYEVAIGRNKWFVCHVRCYSIWLAECRRSSAQPQPKVLETRCRTCDNLLKQYSNAVASFSLAVKDYWSGGIADTSLFAASTNNERRRNQKTLTDNRNALME
ncbi:MAG: hypothetical protein JO299_01320, partial [Gammaproteobacteria bacterium]|nr:hypothetical protein [Gammaproteobacteria bacterium]